MIHSAASLAGRRPDGWCPTAADRDLLIDPDDRQRWQSPPILRGNLEPAATLLSVKRLDRLFHGSPGHWPPASPVDFASAWLLSYFRLVIPAVVGPAFAGIQVHGGTANCRIGLRDGQPEVLDFVRDPASGRVNVEDIYGPLLADHAELAVRTAYAATGLSPRVGWSHVAGELTRLYDRLEGPHHLAEALESHRLVVFGLPANGWFLACNPLFGLERKRR